MKLIKKYVLILVLSLISFIGLSQSGWSSGRYYAYQGGTQTQYQNQNVYDQWCNCYKTVTYCRQLNWYREYRSGYVYYWSGNGWYSKYEQGYFWYCTWTNWNYCY